jgi:hypothetical protein
MNLLIEICDLKFILDLWLGIYLRFVICYLLFIYRSSPSSHPSETESSLH